MKPVLFSLCRRLACSLLLSGAVAPLSAQQRCANPLRLPSGEMIHLADPFVYRDGDRYYLIGTTRQGSGFDYYTSSDLAHWTFAGDAYTKPQGHYGIGSFWAPEVKAYRGKYYLTYSAYDPASKLLLSSLAVSDSPAGPFRDLCSPWFNLGYSAIDCHLFVDDDPQQTPYLFFSRNTSRPGFSSGENCVVKLSEDLLRLEGEPRIAVQASQAWEKQHWETNRCNEGAFVFKDPRSGKYYMSYSANHTGYSDYGVGYAVADEPLGPWVKAAENPILSSDLKKGISAPGHNSIVTSADGREMFIVYHLHANPDAPKPSFDRVVAIDRLRVKRNGKLSVQGPTTAAQSLPSGNRKKYNY